MATGPDTARRLSVIRLLLQRAEETASQPPPYQTDAINRAHDVAEMWLALVAEHLGCDLPKEFIGYWPIISTELGRPLAYKAQMTRMNKTRINLKHYGIEPAPAEVTAALTAVRALVEDETPAVFGFVLADVSLAALMTSQEAAKYVQSAEKAWTRGDQVMAMVDLAAAFETVIADYNEDKRSGWRSIFNSVQKVPGVSHGLRGDDARWKSAVDTSLSRLDEAVVLIGLGIDFRRYSRYAQLVPRISRTVGGDRTFATHRDTYTQEEFNFSRDFVIQSALRLTEFDFTLEDPHPSLGGGGGTYARFTPDEWAAAHPD